MYKLFLYEVIYVLVYYKILRYGLGSIYVTILLYIYYFAVLLNNVLLFKTQKIAIWEKKLYK